MQTDQLVMTLNTYRWLITLPGNKVGTRTHQVIMSCANWLTTFYLIAAYGPVRWQGATKAGKDRGG